MAGIRKKDKSLMDRIVQCVEAYHFEHNMSPSLQEIATELGIGKTTVHSYLKEMTEKGILDYNGKSIETKRMRKSSNKTVQVPILGNIACGGLEFAEENFEEYVSLPVTLFGNGDFFILRTHGDSMIEKGIENGDMVVVRKQNYASVGDIVVALVDGETTLKMYYPEPETEQIRLRPANKDMEDIIVKECHIQGIAQHVIKKL